MPNKIAHILLGGSSSKREKEDIKVKTSGSLWDKCQEQLKPMGLHIDSITPYSLGVYRDREVIGYYNTLSEIKEAIKKGCVQENYNL